MTENRNVRDIFDLVSKIQTTLFECFVDVSYCRERLLMLNHVFFPQRQSHMVWKEVLTCKCHAFESWLIKVLSRSQQPGKICRLWARRLLVSKWIETILKSNACLFACKKAPKFRSVCVYLEISVNPLSFKNCSTHNSYLFHPHSVWFLLQQMKCATKFHSPNKLLHEISLSQTKF